MLTDGFNHVAVLTGDTDRLHASYTEVFDASVGPDEKQQALRLFFRDPDGLEAEVCVPNPDATPGTFNPPGTPARRYVA
jgi:catechol 2,3-dioxygenase-like lactoylglutathione lyase family enzyme